MQLYNIDRPIGYKRNVTETYIVQGNDRMYAASPLKERVKALLFYDEAEEMWRRGSFDIEKDKKMESSMIFAHAVADFRHHFPRNIEFVQQFLIPVKGLDVEQRRTECVTVIGLVSFPSGQVPQNPGIMLYIRTCRYITISHPLLEVVYTLSTS